MQRGALFIQKMLLRELRGEWRLLLLSLLPVFLGVSLIVSLSTLRGFVLERLAGEERVLVGADLSLSIRGTVTPEFEALAAEVPGERVRELRFPSMLTLPEQGRSELIQVQGLSGPFPFYGKRTIEPPAAEFSFLEPGRVLIEEALAADLELVVGDELTIGTKSFQVAGIVLSSPGQTEFRMNLAPRVLLSIEDLREARLLDYGIRQQLFEHFRFPEGQATQEYLEELEERAREASARFETPQTRREALSDSVDKVYAYLDLFIFLVLILGSLAALSGGAHYAEKKQRAVAVLRCLGAGLPILLSVYVLAFGVFSFFVSVLGCLAALPLLSLLTASFAQILPVELTGLLLPDLKALLFALCVGTLFPVFFALPQILSLRKVSPLAALRQELERGSERRAFQLGFALLSFSLCLLVYALLSERKILFLGFAGALFALLLVQFVVASVFRVLAKRGLPLSFPFWLRHGFASLRRPGSDVLYNSVLISLPAFLAIGLWSIRSSLQSEIGRVLDSNGENLIFFDVQADQLPALKDMLAEQKVDFRRAYPLVSMRLRAINERPVTELRAEAKDRRESWYLRREYQNTYRTELLDNEVLLEGEMPQELELSDFDFSRTMIPVSIEARMRERLSLQLGDKLRFDVQGLEMNTEVVGLRKFNFRGLNPGFFVVFPPGVLEAAPQSLVVTSQLDSDRAFTALKQRVAKDFPNISVINAAEIQATLQSIFERLLAVVSGLTSLYLFSTLLLLVVSLRLSSSRRNKERAIYWQIGAGPRVLLGLKISEFYFLGLLATLTALLCSLPLIQFALPEVLNFEPALPWKELSFLLLTLPLFICFVGALSERRIALR